MPPYRRVRLRNGDANATTSDYYTGIALHFYYLGGGTGLRMCSTDGNGVNLIRPWYLAQRHWTFEITLLTADTYRLVVKDGTGVNTLYSSTTCRSQAPARSTAWPVCIQTDGDQVFNSLEISSTSLLRPIFRM